MTKYCSRLLAIALFAVPLIAVPRLIYAEDSGRSLFEQIVALDKQSNAEMRDAWAKGDPAKHGWWTGLNSDLFNRQAELSGRLKGRALAGDSECAFYWGLYNMQDGLKFSESDVVEVRTLAEKAFKDAFSGFQISSKAGMPAASWNIAVLYQRGAGVTQSKLAAAEWYGRAGVQYEKIGDRERALAALERIEEIDAMHPDGLSLRALLFKPKKK
jgi:TPR repeat protein